MRNSEATRAIAVLASYFRQEVTDETSGLWEEQLLPFELEDALEAAELAGKTQIYMPNLAEFLALIRDCRNARVVFERPGLPAADTCCAGEPFAHFYQVHAAPEMKARVDALLKVPTERRRDTTVREAFAKMVGGTL